MIQESIKRKIRRRYGPSLQMLAYLSGLMKLAARLQHKEGAIILMYHSVAGAPETKWIDPRNHVPAEIFARQMEFLSSRRKVVSLDQLVQTLQKGLTPPAGSVVITFDDGYFDNLTIAAPILKRYALPATFFLPTSYIDRCESQWVDQAYTAFKYRSKRWLTWGSEPATRFDLDDLGQRKSGYWVVCEELLLSSREKRKFLLSELNDRLQPATWPPRLTMNWDDVRTLLARARGFQVGGHTLEHTDLTSVSNKEAKIELSACARRISEETGMRPRYFSFCYGRTSNFLRRLAAETGFESACGGQGIDPVIKAPADIFRLPRVEAPPSMERFDLLTLSANTGIWRKLVR